MTDDREGGPRTALVTGATSGIGRAVAERLLSEGQVVHGVGRDFSKLPPDHPLARRAEIDLADLDELPGRLETLAREVPDIDAAVLCAGRGAFGGLEEFSFEEIRSLIDLDLIGQIFVARAFLPRMKRRGRGDLIFIGSEAALAGKRRGAVYCAAKAGLRALAQALREESSTSGVRVSIIHPGPVRTSFFDALDFAPAGAPENAIRPEDVAQAVASVLALPRGTVVDEIHLSPLKRALRFGREAGRGAKE